MGEFLHADGLVNYLYGDKVWVGGSCGVMIFLNRPLKSWNQKGLIWSLIAGLIACFIMGLIEGLINEFSKPDEKPDGVTDTVSETNAS